MDFAPTDRRHFLRTCLTSAVGLVGLARSEQRLHAQSSIGYRVGGYAGGRNEHTGNAKCWFTAGAWWAVLQDDSSNDWGIYKQNQATPAPGEVGGWTHTGVYVDTRDTAEIDVWWNASLKKLHLLRKHTSPIYNEYDLVGTTLVKNVAVGDVVAPGVTANSNGCIAVDSTHQVFFPKITSNGLVICYSTDAARTTFAELLLDPTCNNYGKARPAMCVWSNGGTSSVGVVYQDCVHHRLMFAYHSDKARDRSSDWKVEVIDPAIAEDNHTSVAALKGVVIAVTKNYRNAISVYRRSGTWAPKVDVQPTSCVSRPIVVIDSTYSEAYVCWQTTEETCDVQYRRSNILRPLAFEAPVTVLRGIGSAMWDVQACHHLVTKKTGLMLIAQDRNCSEHWWNQVQI